MMEDKHTMEPYKDNEGNKLYGFSQVSLDKNNKLLKALIVIFGVWTFIFLWIIWKVLSTGAVNNYIAACV